MRKAILLCLLSLCLILSSAGCGSKVHKAPVDIDLSGMSEVMVYSTSIQIAENPEAYAGKTVRIKGTFNITHSEALNRDYYCCLVKDQKGCCTEGLEFVLPADQSYPDVGDVITVSGTYETYFEDGGLYGQLVDAVVE